MCYFLWESTNSMLSVLFATETCYMTKENNKENHFAEASYHFVDWNYNFAGENWGKPILHGHFFAGSNYHFADANWEKPIMHWYFLAKAKKCELQGLE